MKKLVRGIELIRYVGKHVKDGEGHVFYVVGMDVDFDLFVVSTTILSDYESGYNMWGGTSFIMKCEDFGVYASNVWWLATDLDDIIYPRLYPNVELFRRLYPDHNIVNNMIEVL